ncbi:hypothetical protein PVAP13_1NG057300 [Panicum virgatum]|uniref:Uncharacterized protein n=1 Tax=Panicum virgatum TaxID=38727 RepID=A0A8T0WHK5_PANVG|nr:hypothetical protein PVAP13_1NG057300 [Panicum virgatum]
MPLTLSLLVHARASASPSPSRSTPAAPPLPPRPAWPPNLHLPGTRPTLDLAGACSARRLATPQCGGPGRAQARHRRPRQTRPTRSRAGGGRSCGGTTGGCGSGVRLEGAAVAGVAELRSLPSLSYPPARALPSLELGEPSGARAASEVCGPRAAARDPAACRAHTSTSTAPEHSSCRFILTWVKCSCRSPHSPRDIWRRTLGKGSIFRRFEAMPNGMQRWRWPQFRHGTGRRRWRSPHTPLARLPHLCHL